MDEEEVDVAELELLEGILDGPFDWLIGWMG